MQASVCGRPWARSSIGQACRRDSAVPSTACTPWAHRRHKLQQCGARYEPFALARKRGIADGAYDRDMFHGRSRSVWGRRYTYTACIAQGSVCGHCKVSPKGAFMCGGSLRLHKPLCHPPLPRAVSQPNVRVHLLTCRSCLHTSHLPAIGGSARGRAQCVPAALGPSTHE